MYYCVYVINVNILYRIRHDCFILLPNYEYRNLIKQRYIEKVTF